MTSIPKPNRTWNFSPFLFSAALACVTTNPALDSDETDESVDSESTGVDPDESTTTSDSGDTDMASADASESEVDDTDTSESETEAPTVDMAEAPLCQLAGEAADGCQTCVDLHCCDAVAACELDEGCLCLLECLLGGDSDSLCQLNCGVVTQLPSLLMTLDCLDQHCPESCPHGA